MCVTYTYILQVGNHNGPWYLTCRWHAFNCKYNKAKCFARPAVSSVLTEYYCSPVAGLRLFSTRAQQKKIACGPQFYNNEDPHCNVHSPLKGL